MTPLLLRNRPCFEPLVWTVNDETGGNEPDLGELAEKCEEQGCDPYCTPGPSQVRILSLHLLLRSSIFSGSGKTQFEKSKKRGR